MAITATFVADFEQFKTATTEASTALKVFQDTTAQSGAGLQKVEAAARATVPAVGTLHSSLQQFDSLLASMGVHIGPEVRGLGELADVSGKTASQIGLVATAGLGVGAAMGGWQIGRAVADFFDLDKAVQAAWESMLGLGVAAETAGAKQDILARASNTAKREITDLTEAQKINTLAFEDSQHHMGAYRNALEQSAGKVAEWRHEIDRVKADGNFAGLTADIEAHNGSLETLSKRYGISTDALNFLTRSTKTFDDAVKAVDDSIIKRWKDEIDGAKILDDVEIKLHKGFLDRYKAEAEAVAKAQDVKNTSVISGLTQIQAAQDKSADYHAKATLLASDYEIREIWRVVKEEELAFKGSEEQRAQYNKVVEGLATEQADKIIAEARRAEAEALTIVVGHGPDVPNAGAGRAAGGGAGITVPDDILASVAGMNSTSASLEAARQMKLRGFADGGPVMQDGPIYAHAGEYVLPKGGGGMTVVNNFTIVDTAENLARRASDLIMQSILAGKQLAA